MGAPAGGHSSAEAAPRPHLTRFVLDTNVLVSIAWPKGRSHRLVTAWKEGRCRPLVSEEIFDEYLRVLSYPKFRLLPDDVRHILEAEWRPYAELVRVRTRLHVVAEDPSDDKFLECAVDGQADWVVTGDRHLLGLRVFRGIRIGSPSEFLQAIGR